MSGILGGNLSISSQSGSIQYLKTLFADANSQGSFQIGNIRIVMGSVNMGSQSDCNCGNARYYATATITYSGFQVVPNLYYTGYGGSHDGHMGGMASAMSTTSAALVMTNGRSGRVAGMAVRWMVVGVVAQ